tara:strand:- start:151 stop:399 length:249 start_codon:yes stop_codon:yes gene_type:complete
MGSSTIGKEISFDLITGDHPSVRYRSKSLPYRDTGLYRGPAHPVINRYANRPDSFELPVYRRRRRGLEQACPCGNSDAGSPV